MYSISLHIMKYSKIFGMSSYEYKKISLLNIYYSSFSELSVTLNEKQTMKKCGLDKVEWNTVRVNRLSSRECSSGKGYTVLPSGTSSLYHKIIIIERIKCVFQHFFTCPINSEPLNVITAKFAWFDLLLCTLFETILFNNNSLKHCLSLDHIGS